MQLLGLIDNYSRSRHNMNLLQSVHQSEQVLHQELMVEPILLLMY
jgi:hypothetical protein